MKTFKNGFLYFIKTQLMITIVFSVIFGLANILALLLRGLLYSLIVASRGGGYYSSIKAEIFFLIIPAVVFFACGLYYKQKKKPEGIIARYFPVVFPIVFILFAWLFYSKIYVTGFYEMPWLELPYNWVYFSPIGFFLTEGSEISDMDTNDILFTWILPLIHYFLFLLGYMLGERPFSVRFFSRFSDDVKD